MPSTSFASKRNSELSGITTSMAVVIAIAALYLGQEVLIPFALALLLTFILSPPVTWLEKIRLGRIVSVLLVLTLSFAILGSLLWLGTTQLAAVISRLPEYKNNIERKIVAMRNPAGFGLTNAVDSVSRVKTELENDELDGTKSGAASPVKKLRRHAPELAKQTQPVAVVKEHSGIFASFGVIGASIARSMAMGLAVVIFSLFMLLQRGDLRNRLFRLFGTGHMNVMTTALDDAAHRISKYLLSQCLVNGAFGLLLGVGLYFIGVPNAPFWGVLGAVLRFIPYIGTLIAGLCPLIMALAVFEGWSRPLVTLGLFATIEITLSAAVEPLLYGAHTGISSLAVLVSAAFWTLLWGPIGLVLSTPLTVCLVVLGHYVSPLKFLTVLLSDEPVLPPEARYYQRLLALDDEEAREVVDEYLKDKTLRDLYQSVLVPALSLAEKDRHQNALDQDRENFIYQSTRDLVEELGERDALPGAESGASPSSRFLIMCVPARDEADELVGLMLTQLLRMQGHETVAIPIAAVDDMIRRVQEAQPDIVFVSALPPYATSQTRSLCRRVRQTNPGLKIAVGFWDPTVQIESVQKRLGPSCFDGVITGLEQAELQVRLLKAPAEIPEPLAKA